MPADTLEQNLDQAFNFGDAELTANQNGWLTPRQENLLAKTRRIRGCSTAAAALVGGVISLIFILVLVLVIIPNASGLGAPWPILTLPVILFMGVFFGALALGIRRGRDLNSGRISVEEGQPQLTSRKIVLGSGNRMMGYYVTIGSTRFQVATSEQFAAFQPDLKYRVYYIKDPPVHIIMSVEILDKNT
jgi:hypothetical protein